MEGSGRSEAAWGLPRNEVTMSTPQHASGPWSELYPPPGVPLKTGSVRVTLDPGQTPGSSTASGVPPATSKGGTLEWVRPQRPVIHPEVGRRLGVCGDTRQWRGREPAMLPPRPLGVRGPFKSGRCFGLGAGKTARGAAGRSGSGVARARRRRWVAEREETAACAVSGSGSGSGWPALPLPPSRSWGRAQRAGRRRRVCVSALCGSQLALGPGTLEEPGVAPGTPSLTQDGARP